MFKKTLIFLAFLVICFALIKLVLLDQWYEVILGIVSGITLIFTYYYTKENKQYLQDRDEYVDEKEDD